jgi:hypothetical protein
MICAFMGTVIGLERAVAVKHPLAFLGPLRVRDAGVGGARRAGVSPRGSSSPRRSLSSR